jgi:hypothetical protein
MEAAIELLVYGTLEAAASNPWQALAKALLTRSGVRQLSPLARDDQTYHDDGTVSAPSIVGSVGWGMWACLARSIAWSQRVCSSVMATSSRGIVRTRSDLVVFSAVLPPSSQTLRATHPLVAEDGGRREAEALAVGQPFVKELAQSALRQGRW